MEGHVHDDEGDYFYVLDGALTVALGEQRDVVVAGRGTYVLVPQGTRHAIHNDGPADVRVLNIHAPGGLDRRIGC